MSFHGRLLVIWSISNNILKLRCHQNWIPIFRTKSYSSLFHVAFRNQSLHLSIPFHSSSFHLPLPTTLLPNSFHLPGYLFYSSLTHPQFWQKRLQPSNTEIWSNFRSVRNGEVCDSFSFPLPVKTWIFVNQHLFQRPFVSTVYVDIHLSCETESTRHRRSCKLCSVNSVKGFVNAVDSSGNVCIFRS